MDSQSNKINLEKVCYEIPKAELHIHIEGTFEPELMFELAKRNNIQLPYQSIEEVKKKYEFNNLGEFLEIYYAACDVLITEEDFQDLMYSYLKKAFSQGLKYAEVFFDPQTHTKRGIAFKTIMNGLKRGIEKGKNDLNLEVNLIMCFLRDMSEEEAFKTLEEAMPYKNDILAVGLDSNEIDNPPEKFKNVFSKVKELGFRITAHAAEEGPHDNITKSIELLHAERIDHGIRITQSQETIKFVAERKIPLTLCPLSNYWLKGVPDLSKYQLREMIKENLLVCLNSDDPAYFRGYIGDNYLALLKSLNLNLEEIHLLASNSFRATFLLNEKKENYIETVDNYVKSLHN